MGDPEARFQPGTLLLSASRYTVRLARDKIEATNSEFSRGVYRHGMQIGAGRWRRVTPRRLGQRCCREYLACYIAQRSSPYRSRTQYGSRCSGSGRRVQPSNDKGARADHQDSVTGMRVHHRGALRPANPECPCSEPDGRKSSSEARDHASVVACRALCIPLVFTLTQ